MIVFDASPLVHFAVAGELALLGRLVRQAGIPPRVRDELVVDQPDAPGAAALRRELDRRRPWLQVHELDAVGAARAEALAAPPLDTGEAAAIALALQLDAILVIDERAGRRAAEARGLTVTGTIGLLLKAKERGLIPAVRPVLDSMIASGLRISPGLREEALRTTGEG